MIVQLADLEKVYDEVDDDEQDIITTHWVITQKKPNNAAQSEGNTCLAARSFEGKFTDQHTDSPSIIQENLCHVFNVTLSNKRKRHQEIKSAFLQGA